MKHVRALKKRKQRPKAFNVLGQAMVFAKHLTCEGKQWCSMYTNTHTHKDQRLKKIVHTAAS